MGDVVILEGPTRLPIPVDRVIKGALEYNIEKVIIIGLCPDGEYYYASSFPDKGQHLLMLERFKEFLLR